MKLNYEEMKEKSIESLEELLNKLKSGETEIIFRDHSYQTNKFFDEENKNIEKYFNGQYTIEIDVFDKALSGTKL